MPVKYIKIMFPYTKKISFPIPWFQYSLLALPIPSWNFHNPFPRLCSSRAANILAFDDAKNIFKKEKEKSIRSNEKKWNAFHVFVNVIFLSYLNPSIQIKEVQKKKKKQILFFFPFVWDIFEPLQFWCTAHLDCTHNWTLAVDPLFPWGSHLKQGSMN